MCNLFKLIGKKNGSHALPCLIILTGVKNVGEDLDLKAKPDSLLLRLPDMIRLSDMVGDFMGDRAHVQQWKKMNRTFPN